ncbi:hypothetical protein [Streptomyces sp. SID2119]|uniref:hypothetical protein n=1 Tax=Streptomyces sp. SID2119 TaxID=2690253 RepID=UPI001F42A9D9|nr:hypothetical protein [Streptomyces sp. SID2119]
MPYEMENGFDTSDGQCVRLYAHEDASQRTRIYLRAHFDPGISSLPAAPPRHRRAEAPPAGAHV